jgi:hypothetical protein
VEHLQLQTKAVRVMALLPLQVAVRQPPTQVAAAGVRQAQVLETVAMAALA